MQGAVPSPSGSDIATTIKYFTQTLLSKSKIIFTLKKNSKTHPILAVLKDVPNSPLELLKNPEMDATRMALFPSLDYKALYNSLIPLIEVAPLIQYGLHGKWGSCSEGNRGKELFPGVTFLPFGYSFVGFHLVKIFRISKLASRRNIQLDFGILNTGGKFFQPFSASLV